MIYSYLQTLRIKDELIEDMTSWFIYLFIFAFYQSSLILNKKKNIKNNYKDILKSTKSSPLQVFFEKNSKHLQHLVQMHICKSIGAYMYDDILYFISVIPIISKLRLQNKLNIMFAVTALFFLPYLEKRSIFFLLSKMKPCRDLRFWGCLQQ